MELARPTFLYSRGIVTKTKGIVNVWGFDLDKNPRQVKASIGIVPQEINRCFCSKKLLSCKLVCMVLLKGIELLI